MRIASEEKEGNFFHESTMKPRSPYESICVPGYVVMAVVTAVVAGGCRKSEPDGPRARSYTPTDPGFNHVIFISIDTLRKDHLGCYGHPFVQTPHLDSIAREGWRFTRCYASAPTTLASHTAMFTGTYPHTHGTPRNGFIVNDDNVMLAEVLKTYGFKTAAFVGSYALASDYNFHQGFDHYDEKFDMKPEGASFFVERRAEKVTDAAIAWLDKNKTDRLFLFAHYFDVHFPYQPPDEFAELYLDRIGEFKPNDGSLPLDPLKEQLAQMRDGRDALPEVQAIDGYYSGEVTYTDTQVGRLLDDLRNRGILENALLVITAGHGETLAEHHEFFNHGYETYNTTVASPLIIRLPDTFQDDDNGKDNEPYSGQVADRLISHIDLMPTVLELFGMERPDRAEGMSFAPLFRNQPLAARGPVFSEATKPFDVDYETHPVWFNSRKTRCLINEKFKVIHRPLTDEWELYHIERDTTERVDLLRMSGSGIDFKNDPLLIEMKTQLAEWDESADPLPTVEEVADKSRQNLRTLEYTGGEATPQRTGSTGNWTNTGL
jgi:arylsulfatase A-like enzyme